MNYRCAARPDHELDETVRAKCLYNESASDETLARIAARSKATVTRVVREVRLEERTDLSNQGGIGSCYANAWIDAMELLQPAGSVVQLSRMFAYFNSRLAHGDQCRDEGTFGSTMGSRIHDIGVCKEISWPYDGAPADQNKRIFVRPELANYEEAYDHRCDSSFVIRERKLADRVRSVKNHLDFGFPIVGALSIGNAWDEPARDAVLEPPMRVEGGHAIVIDGYLEKSDGEILFDVRNSWGRGWGREGHIYISARHLDVAFCDRLDVIVLSPSFGGSKA